MRRIGHYIVERNHGQWAVVCLGEIVSMHDVYWNAMRAARAYDWQDRHEKRPPAPEGTGGEEPKSKWRWAYIGGTNG